jgi:hypothetical protein
LVCFNGTHDDHLRPLFAGWGERSVQFKFGILEKRLMIDRTFSLNRTVERFGDTVVYGILVRAVIRAHAFVLRTRNRINASCSRSVPVKDEVVGCEGALRRGNLRGDCVGVGHESQFAGPAPIRVCNCRAHVACFFLLSHHGVSLQYSRGVGCYRVPGSLPRDTRQRNARVVFRFTSTGGEVTQIFSLIQAQNVQITFLIVLKSGEPLIFVIFFNLISDPLRMDFCVVIF